MADEAQEFSAANLRQLADEADRLERQVSGMETMSAEAAAAIANPIEVFCRLWPTLRSILEFVLKIPFVPGSIKAAIRAMIPVLDSLCRG